MSEPRLSAFPSTCLFIQGSFKARWIYEMMKGAKDTAPPGGSQSVGRAERQVVPPGHSGGVIRPVSVLRWLSKRSAIHLGGLLEITNSFLTKLR